MTFRLIAAAVIFLAPPAYSQDEIPAGCVRVRERLEYEKKVLEFNSGKMDAMGYFIENGVPSDVGNAFLGAGGPPASREGASKSVLGTFVPYNKELRDLKVGAPPAGRYVSRGSLEQQLTYAEAEIQPLKQTASLRTFSFSNTVTTNHGNGLGWQGLNFRLKPGGETFKIRAHFRLTDATTRAQHEVVKLSGVNLIHGAYAHLGRLAEVGGVEARREVLA
ncbi:MAG: hypothetical protein ACXVBW_06720, partial [Bdellovibrionota bacterium]